MTDRLPGILETLGSSAPEGAWCEFLETYAPVLLQVARIFEHDPDQASDCFLYICEQLRAKRFRRLRRFQTAGPASFETWLRAVARNLCLDWRRREFGRHRPFRSIERLSAFDQEVFHLVYQRRLPADEAAAVLAGRYPGNIRESAAESLVRLEQALTPRQIWLLATQRPRIEPLPSQEENPAGTPTDSAPSPEDVAIFHQRDALLATALSRLSPSERLLLRYRFDQELTLREIAGLTGLKDPQTVDRRIAEVLGKLRIALGRAESPGKARAASV